jgi:hypothetical protein
MGIGMTPAPHGTVTEVRTLPAAAGWTWLRQALALYRRQAFAFTALVMLYLMSLMVLTSVPFVGLVLAAILVPFATVGLTLAGRAAERGVIPLPSMLIDGMRNDRQRVPLFRLGAIHAALAVLVSLVASFAAVDEQRKWQVVDGRFDPGSVLANFPWDAFVLNTVLYVPVLMLTWFSPQLVAWHSQPVGKAMFFSFVACWRNRWAFISLAGLLFLLSLGAVSVAVGISNVFDLSPPAAAMLLGPLLLVVTSIHYAAQYPIYRAVIEPGNAINP